MNKAFISRITTLSALVLTFSISSAAFASTGVQGVVYHMQEAPQAPNSSLSSELSRNWSGYVATGSSYTGIAGSWIIPAATSSSPVSADATWIGIGGAETTDLIQTGTQAIDENGSEVYQAWYELLPNASIIVPLTVHAGDAMSASINETSSNTWDITLNDITTDQTYSNTVTYDSSLSSAEWIEEMPTDDSGNFVPLDNFGTVSFTNATATINGQRETLTQSSAQPLTMTDGTSVLAEPSSIGSDNESFSVSRTDISSDVPAQTIRIQRGFGWRTGRGDQSQSEASSTIWSPFGDGFGPGPVAVPSVPGFPAADFQSLFGTTFPFGTGSSSDIDTISTSTAPVTRTITLPDGSTVTETSQSYTIGDNGNGFSVHVSF